MKLNCKINSSIQESHENSAKLMRFAQLMTSQVTPRKGKYVIFEMLKF